MDVTSPYTTGGGGGANFGPPPGLADVMATRENNNTQVAIGAGRNVGKLADMLTDFSQQQKAIKAQGTAAKTAMKTSPELLQAVGLHPDQVDNLSNPDAAAMLTGAMKKQGYDQAQAEIQQQKALAARAQSQADAEGGDARLLQMLDGKTNVPTDPYTDQPMTDDPETSAIAGSLTPIQKAVIHAGASMGPNQRGSASAIYRALLPAIMGDTDGSSPAFVTDKDSVPGWALTGRKGSKQWQALPTGGAKVTMVDDGQGGQVPIVQGPKGNVTQLKPAQTGLTDDQLLKSYDRQETALHSDLTMQPQDKAGALQKIDDARQEILDRQKKPAAKSDSSTKGSDVAPPEFGSANDVKAAYSSGKLSKTDAAKILQQKFGMQ